MNNRTGKKGLRISIRPRMLIYNSITILVVAFGTALLSYKISGSIIDNYYKNLTMDCAENFAVMVDPEFLMEFRRTIESDEYQAVREHAEETDNEQEVKDFLVERGLWEGFIHARDQIDNYIETMDAIKYTYILARNEEGGTLDMYIMDDSTNPAYVAGSFIESEPEFYDIDASQRIEPTISNGDWGWLCSAYVPIFLEDGTLVGQIGCDIGMDEVMQERNSYFAYILLGAVVLTLLMAVLSGSLLDRVLVRRVTVLTNELKNFNPSPVQNYNEAGVIRPKEKDNDELDDLYHSVHDMQVRIIDNINEMDAMNIELERAARMKSDFLANMSHEIRTPMNAVIGMAEIASREELPQTALDALIQIQKSGKNLLNIINDILDYSKIESGKFDIVPVEYHPVEEINDVSNVILNKLSEKPVVLDVDIDPNLPGVLCGDSNRIRQILINIAGNAVKFTNKGSVTIRAAFERIDDKNILLKLIVIDTGIGIKEEDKNKLFDSFTQLDSKRNRNVEGTGLGLAISKRLVELMNGSLKIDSEYGKGSIFTVEIPQQIVDGIPSAHVNEPEKCAALYMFSNPVSNSAFERDATRLGVISKEVKERINMKQECLDMLSKHPGCTLFVFTDTVTVTSLRPEFINSRNDILPVLVTDYGSKLKLSLKNLIFATNPLFTANMAMIFNKEKAMRSDGNETDVADFTAPFANILVVDDNHVNLTIAVGLLEPLKMNIKKASSGKEAIRLCGVNTFDLILMDHMMPEMDGVEAMHAIREKYPEYVKKPIIALTANAVGDAKKALLDEGMNDFIPKPIDVKTLVAVVRKWLPAHLIMKMTDEEIAKAEQAQKDKKPADNLVIGDLNVQDAIAKLGGEALFYNILKDYYRIIPEKSALIRKALEEKDWKSFTIEVHSLKSTSGQIGATEVQRMAAKLEDAGRKEDEAFIKEHAGELLERYTAYESVFKPFCDDGKDKNVTKSEVDKEVLLKAFDDLRAAADDLDFDRMEEIVEKLSRYRYSDIEKELFMKLKKAVSDIDPDTALEMISEWNDVL